MGWYTPDVYHQPEHFNLIQVAQMSWTNESYQYDYTVFWVGKKGKLYMASDSGCSCPSPFENYTSKDKLTKVTRAEAIKYIQERLDKMQMDAENSSYWRDDYEYSNGQATQAIENLLSKVKSL